jgi:hypothetical protein
VEENEAANPVDVGLLGAQAVMARAESLADAVEEPGLGDIGRPGLADHGDAARGITDGVRERVAKGHGAISLLGRDAPTIAHGSGMGNQDPAVPAERQAGAQRTSWEGGAFTALLGRPRD